jgi:hypothetical protein
MEATLQLMLRAVDVCSWLVGLLLLMMVGPAAHVSECGGRADRYSDIACHTLTT